MGNLLSNSKKEDGEKNKLNRTKVKTGVKDTEVKTDEVKTDEVKDTDVKTDDVKTDDIKTDDVKDMEVKDTDVKSDDVKDDEVKTDDVKTEDILTNEFMEETNIKKRKNNNSFDDTSIYEFNNKEYLGFDINKIINESKQQPENIQEIINDINNDKLTNEQLNILNSNRLKIIKFDKYYIYKAKSDESKEDVENNNKEYEIIKEAFELKSEKNIMIILTIIIFILICVNIYLVIKQFPKDFLNKYLK